MKSKTLIEKQANRKSNSEVVETILSAKKESKNSKTWLEVASLISRPKRKQIKMNLDRIDNETKEGDNIVVPGKVLGQGELSKKVKIIALSFSESAIKKIEDNKGKFSYINEEIKNNKKAEGLKILK